MPEDDDIDWDLIVGPTFSQAEIATLMGVSRSRVSQHEASAMKKLREALGSDATMSLYEWERTCNRRREERVRVSQDPLLERYAKLKPERGKGGRFKRKARGISADRGEQSSEG